MRARMRALAGAMTTACLVVPLAAGLGSAGASAASSSVGRPPAVADPVGATRGSWDVRADGPGRYVVSWTSPTRLPRTSDRPLVVGPDDAVIGVPTLSADGRTLTSVVSAATAPSAATLDVVLSGRVLDRRGAAPSSRPAGAGRASQLPTQTLADDPGAPGPFAVTTSDYTIDPVKLAGMPEPIEMVGHVVEPTAASATGPRPLVLFMHGRHEVCYAEDRDVDTFTWPCVAPAKEIPSHLGYDYIQRLLASQGFTTVSVRVNGINAQDYRLPDGGAGARASIVVAHLEHWRSLAAAHQVDLSQVVLVGHSRGGEGVDRASIRIPAGAPYRIAGQVLLAPTDFANQAAPYVPTVTVLPYCDGDVYDIQGQKFTDDARDLTTDDTSLKSSVLVMGANHNYFNTEWTPGVAQAPSFDDWGGAGPCGKGKPTRLKAKDQRRVGKTYVAGAVRLFTGEGQYLPLYDGTAATVASVGDADVRSHAIGGGRDLRKPGAASLTLPAGATSQLCVGVISFDNRFGQCGRGIDDAIGPHWANGGERIPTRRFLEMSWTAAGQRAGLALDRPLDLSTGRLELRTIVDSARGDARLDVRITDADGASAVLTPEGGGLVPALLRSPGLTKLWAQSVVVDPVAATGVDLTRIRDVELVSRNARGRVWVVDVSSAPDALAAVPARRLPTLTLGSLRLDEGNRPGTHVARMPFRVTGDVSRPMRVDVVTVGQERGSVQSFSIELAAGQTSGSVPVSYTADRHDDLSPAITTASIWATRNIMTDAYVGDVRVIDDDPTPRITVAPKKKTVREGESIEVVVTLAKRVDYDLFLTGKVRYSPSPLRASDVPKAWRDKFAPTDDLDATLSSLHPFLFERIRAGERRAVFTIPILADGVAEGRESITLRIGGRGHAVERTIYVAPSS